MAWTLFPNECSQYYVLDYTGEITTRELLEASSAAIEIEKRQHVNRFLANVADMKLSPSTTLSDIVDIPAQQFVVEGADRDGRVAIYAPETSEELEVVNFYETACRNRGWNVRVFDDRDEAVEWLTADEHNANH